jgi:hypothetical protein
LGVSKNNGNHDEDPESWRKRRSTGNKKGILKTKSREVNFLVHTGRMYKRTSKRVKLAFESQGTTIIYLNFGSRLARDICCDAKHPSKVKVGNFRTTLMSMLKSALPLFSPQTSAYGDLIFQRVI